MLSKHVDTASINSVFAAYGELSRHWSREQMLMDAFFSSANRFDEIVRDVCETTLDEELVLDYRPACAAPSFEEIQRCYDDLAKHLNKVGKPLAVIQGIHRISRTWLFGLAQRSTNLLGAVDWLVTESVNQDLEDSSNTVPLITPDFSHRLSPVGFEQGTLGLLDTVNMAADKLLATVNMLSDHFALDDDENRPSDETVFFALHSVKHEALDIKAVMAWFHSNEKL